MPHNHPNFGEHPIAEYIIKSCVEQGIDPDDVVSWDLTTKEGITHIRVRAKPSIPENVKIEIVRVND